MRCPNCGAQIEVRGSDASGWYEWGICRNCDSTIYERMDGFDEEAGYAS